MDQQAGAYRPAPERFRDYLLLLARTAVGGLLRRGMTRLRELLADAT